MALNTDDDAPSVSDPKNMRTRKSKILFIILACAYFNASYATLERILPTSISIAEHLFGQKPSKPQTENSDLSDMMRRKHARMIRSFSIGHVLACVAILPGDPHRNLCTGEVTTQPESMYHDEWIQIESSDVSPPLC